MKVSYKWLKEYIKTDLSPDEMAAILTDTGLEVEGVEKIEAVRGGLAGVVVGEVISCEKHPDADRLKVTTINIGETENLQIVCGAPNVGKGQKVIVATVGCTLYPKPEEEFKIKKSKIRGIESMGMLCAEDELGLGQSHDGILVLPDATQVGISAANYFDLEDDYSLEIGLTPNRADAMGHIGVARDLAAYLSVHKEKTELIWPSIATFSAKNIDRIEIITENKEACPAYTGTVISNVKVEASPAWMQNRLRAIGMSPINNIVDITNYVMMELGTPLHAFDLSKIGTKVVVKNAVAGEKFVTLDEVERTLSADDQMITNGKENLCIAGVFGGVDSGISDKTVNVFLESAYFEPVSTRTTARRHGLNTDASFRFERGVDPELTMFALKRAAMMIKEIAGGEITMEPLAVRNKEHKRAELEFSLPACEQLIGCDISHQEIKNILKALDIEIKSDEGDKLLLSIPQYRVDVTRQADVVEEVLRIYGFNKVPIPAKLNSSIPVFKKPNIQGLKNSLSELLSGMGFSEILNNSLTSSSYVEKLGGDCYSSERNVSMLNPLSQELDVMRQSMIFSAMEVIAHNQNRQSPDLKLMEFGKTYHKYEHYHENERMLLAITGKKHAESWNITAEPQNFYAIKGYAMALFNRLGLGHLVSFKPIKNSLLEDGLQIFVLKQKVGEVGWVNKKIQKHFGVKNTVFIADLDWDGIADSLKLSKIKYQELPKTFATRRDFSLLLNKEVTFGEVESVAKKCDKKILKSVGLFDVYEGDKLEEGKKSYAVSFIFQDDNQTLKDQQVDKVMESIRTSLESQLKAELRK
ncbi:MAG: phenylalanyl-tRNA synthetase beta chain [Psychromonas sp.]|jgi:phenylalanyl-tRNA synthetase beta chain